MFRCFIDDALFLKLILLDATAGIGVSIAKISASDSH